MRGYAKTAIVSILMMGLLAVPNLSPATDGDGRHRLLNAELRSKIEHVGNKIKEHREHHQNQGGIPGSIQALQTEVAILKTALADAKNQLNLRLDALAAGTGSTPSTSPALVELAKYVTVVQGDLKGVTGPHVIFHDANLHVQDGFGTTAEAGAPTGRGNLIVGYNEMPVPVPDPSSGYRAGSHNLVVGTSHTFNSTGGAVFGNSNLISGQHATILGGEHNTASGPMSSILGGAGSTTNLLLQTYP